MGTRYSFTEFEMKQLEKNPNVSRVSEKTITYTPEFKLKAVKENLTGKSPITIFVENGFDLTVIGENNRKNA
jgi:transposase